LINLVCDRALLGGYSARTNRITPEMVRAAATGLELAAPRASILGWLRRRVGAFAAGAALTAVISAAAWYGVITLHARSASRSGEQLEPTPLAAGAPARLPDVGPPPIVPEATPTQAVATSGTTLREVATPVAHPQVADAAGAPRPQTGGRYSVLVGSFRHDAEAAVLVEQLRGLGYEARSGRVESEERGVWHQVFVGPYRDIDVARQDEARVRQLPGYADARLTTH
jgi:cell division septation protein DedD